MLLQTPYRKKLKRGDIFCLSYPNHQYVFGVIVSLTAEAGGFRECIKIHVYDYISTEIKLPNDLNSLPLMFAPLFINRLGFSRGYMPVIDNHSLDGEVSLENVCYHSVIFSKYYDDKGHLIEHSKSVVGIWGLSNYLVLDDLVSEQLGLEVIDS